MENSNNRPEADHGKQESILPGQGPEQGYSGQYFQQGYQEMSYQTHGYQRNAYQSQGYQGQANMRPSYPGQPYQVKRDMTDRRKINRDTAGVKNLRQMSAYRNISQDTGQEKKSSIPKVVLGWTFEILIVIMFAYVMVFFFGQSRTNVGQSMDVTLSGGDVVLINTLAYQIGGPKRGDIISFRPNGNTSSRSNIKRVIGLPGERVQIIDGMIYINDQVYLEQKNYPSITNPGMASEPITLGDKQYFVLGDNRNSSEDSRFADVGLVESSSIEGKVWFILNPGEHRGLL